MAQEAEDALHNNCCVLLQMDGNLHLSNAVIKGDPCQLDQNGKYFINFLNIYPHLKLVNSMPVTEGLITRSRVTVNKVENSIIDFFVVCDKLAPFIEKLVIDEKKDVCLTNYSNKKGQIKVKDSDHHTMILDLNIKFPQITNRHEIFNVKSIKNQKAFK